ncbi:MAG: GGDEF domain-containing protein [Candidatus Dormibacteraeota bacterium]|nr:GGDEF domain-containing protein [Candidatus Dormibacteraeota bacterium]
MSATAGAGDRPERRELVARAYRDRLARWLDLHPASLAGLGEEPLHALTTLLDTARVSSGRARQLGIELEDLKATAQELEELARRDTLTGAANRRAVEERLLEEWERAMRYRRPLAVFIADVDHLKQVNDAHGHPAGDRLLKEVANRLQSVLRSGDLFGRLGGDEFVVICPETTAEAAAQVAHKLIEAASATPVEVSERRVDVSLSVGWAVSGDQEQARQLLSAADDALYSAKASGRGRSHGPGVD